MLSGTLGAIRAGDQSARRAGLDPISRSLSRTLSVHVPGARPVAADENSVPVEAVVLDFTVRSKIRITSSESLEWVTAPSADAASRALMHFLDQSQRSCRDDDVLFHSALYSWVHPSSPMTSDMIMKEASQESRRIQWEIAFHSLYYLFREGACDHFYLCATRFAVLFVAPGVAIVTRSNVEFRAALRNAAVDFTMPLHARDEDDDADVDFRCDGTPQSCLVIRGRSDIHGLFDILINRKYIGDVPKLFSLHPFKNSSMQCHCPTFNQVTVSTKEIGGDRARLLGQSFVVEFAGSFLPVQIGWITEALRRHRLGRGTFSIRTWSEGITVPVNHAGCPELVRLAKRFGWFAVGDDTKPVWSRVSSDPMKIVSRVVVADDGACTVEFGSAPGTSAFASSGSTYI